MTVLELIEKLQKYDGNLNVECYSLEGDSVHISEGLVVSVDTYFDIKGNEYVYLLSDPLIHGKHG